MSPSRFQLYRQENDTCFLKVTNESEVRQFPTVSDALRAIVSLSREHGHSPLTVYDPLGSVIFEAQL